VAGQERWATIAPDLPTPALVYDLDEVARLVGGLRADLRPLARVELCFAVKANRNPAVLRRLAGLGLGADVATLPELDAAAAAGLSPVYATSPALGAAELKAFDERGVIPDLDSLSQLRLWTQALPRRRRIGLRLRVPVPPAARARAARSPWSRFGIDPTDPALHDELAARRLKVAQLHLHAGELLSPQVLVDLAGVVAEAVRVFSDVERVNLGGGLAYLYRDPPGARRAWQHVAAVLNRLPAAVVEPGELLTARAGFLVASVRAAENGAGSRLVTLDASAWSLMPWTRPRLVAAVPARDGGPVRQAVAGSTCYEGDYFLRAQQLPRLEVGDRVVLGGAGAYVASMARSSHGLPPPREFVLEGGELHPA
jgi:diaminopimelate decarboxylase